MKSLMHIVLVLVVNGSCFAETWTVDDDGKADFDNIQAAVDAASDGDEIIVMPGNYTSTSLFVIDLQGKEVLLRSAEGPLTTILNGENKRRVVSCTDGESSSTIIDGFTITNGSGTTGGGITVIESSPNIQNCIISENQTLQRGGGLYNYSGNPTLLNCTITGNTANIDGGGVKSINGSVELVDCVVCGNNPDQLSGNIIDVSGNIICDSDNILTVDDDSVDYSDADFDNIQDAINAATDGDEILVFPGTYLAFVLTPDNPVSNITIKSTFGASETMIDGDLESEDYPFGLGIKFGGYPSGGDSTNMISNIWFEGFTIQNCVRVGVPDGGGGIYAHFVDELTIKNCIIKDCFSFNGSQGGGGINIDNCSNIDIVNTTIKDNYATLYGPGGFPNRGGGGVFVSGANYLTDWECGDIVATFTNCTISDNQAGKGGGLCLDNSGVSVEMINCTISNNSAFIDGGGGFYAYGSSEVVVGCDEGSTFQLTGCVIQENYALKGSAIRLRNFSRAMITNCTILDNTNNDSPNGLPALYAETSKFCFMGNNEIQDLEISLFTSELSLDTDSYLDITGNLTTSDYSLLNINMDSLSDTLSLNVSDTIFQEGTLRITDDEGVFSNAIAGSIIPLATASELNGEFDAIGYPLMPSGLGLELIETSNRGANAELALEIIEVDVVNFTAPFNIEVDGEIINLLSFDADGNGVDEIAVLFDGNPGAVLVFEIFENQPAQLINNYSAVISNPSDFDAGDINGDGLDDLVVVKNGVNQSVIMLLTTIDTEGNLSFNETLIADGWGDPEIEFKNVCLLDWDGNSNLDLAFTFRDINIESTLVGTERVQLYLDISDTNEYEGQLIIPAFNFDPENVNEPDYSDYSTDLDGGMQTDSWGFVLSTRFGQIYRPIDFDWPFDEDFVLLGSIPGRNISSIEVAELNDDGGDGEVDIIVTSDEIQVIGVLEGNPSNSVEFFELFTIPLPVPAEDIAAIDADNDGDMDFFVTAPTVPSPPIFVQNGGNTDSLTGSLRNRSWSSSTTSTTEASRKIISGSLGGKDEDDDWVVGGGNSTNAGLVNTESSSIEQLNMLPNCPCDLNSDRVVSVEDLLLLIADWGTCSNCDADFDSNNEVDVEDLLVLIAAWGPCS